MFRGFRGFTVRVCGFRVFRFRVREFGGLRFLDAGFGFRVFRFRV